MPTSQRPKIKLIDCTHLIGKYPEYKTSNKAYQVKAVFNSTEYQLNSFLSKYEVDCLISGGWIVEISERKETK